MVIDSSVLHATDIDSDDERLLYSITQPVTRGWLYQLTENGTEINVLLFTPLELKEGKLGHCAKGLDGYKDQLKYTNKFYFHICILWYLWSI